jgi:RNA polymerase sigma-70 factor (ECF subfamily)
MNSSVPRSSEVGRPDQAAVVIQAIQTEYGLVRNAIRVIASRYFRGLKGESLDQKVDELMSEVACRAIAKPASFQPGRPVVPWLIGIARNVVRGEARDAYRQPQVTSFDETSHDPILRILVDRDRATSDRIDLETMLSRLKPGSRAAIEFRFFKGLDGPELAEALGAASAGAARVRLARALNELRILFGAQGSEGTR